MKTDPKTVARRVEIEVCKRIEAASERDGCIKAGQVGAEMAAEFLTAHPADSEFLRTFVALGAVEMINRFCEMPRSKWPLPVKKTLPSALRDLPFAMKI